MRLRIIGNGFDLHHGLKTGYWNYRDYLICHGHIKTIKDYEFLTRLSGTPAWNNVEASLEINYSEYIESLLHHDNTASDIYPETYLEEELRFLFSFTGEAFVEWLENLDYSEVIPDPALNLSQNDLYITYNYTDTLQRVYNIPDDRILFIHGRLKDIDTSLFGIGDVFPTGTTQETVDGIDPIVHGDELENDLVHSAIQFGADAMKTVKKYTSVRNKYYIPNSPYLSLLDQIDTIVHATTKDVRLNFDKLKRFICGKSIDEVVIMGHSLAEPDSLYFTEVLIQYLKNSKWTIMRHLDKKETDNDFERKIAPLMGLIGKKVNILDW